MNAIDRLRTEVIFDCNNDRYRLKQIALAALAVAEEARRDHWRDLGPMEKLEGLVKERE